MSTCYASHTKFLTGRYQETSAHLFEAYKGELAIEDVKAQKPKAIPFERSWEVYQQHKTSYDAMNIIAGGEPKGAILATVLLISGCQDNQLSMDGSRNGAFTGALKRTWNNGAFSGNYKRFHEAIVDRLPPTQTPNYLVVGATNLAFEAQSPFSL